jgi:hypothetical protein
MSDSGEDIGEDIREAIPMSDIGEDIGEDIREAIGEAISGNQEPSQEADEARRTCSACRVGTSRYY